MKTIRLFGDLSAFKQQWSLDVKTPAEALRAIHANRPGFLEAADRGEYVLILFDAERPELIRQVIIENANSPWAHEELHIIPRAGGEVPPEAIVAAFAAIDVALEAGSFAVIAMTAIVNIGISLAVSALANLITGPKKTAVSVANNPSFIINGTVNVINEGNPYPIPAGEFLCGSIVLSSRIIITDIPA